MEEEWSRLQQALTTCFSQGVTFKDGIENQFLNRLIQIITDASAGHGDIFAGYADALRAAHASGISAPWLPLPPELTDAPAPEWGMTKSPAAQQIQLAEEADLALTRATYQRKIRRNLLRPETDPALKRLLPEEPWLTHYQGFGQQAAIRTLLTSDNNCTLLVNLPTSCGKSLLTQLQALSAPTNTLTLVIVPTVALAIEQADDMQKLLRGTDQDHGGSYAWIGGQDQPSRQAIKERIKTGTQRVLFCSPESVRSSLVPVLFELSRLNMIGAIVIDEAHLIDQWGAEFRPDFQLIAPMIRSLKALGKCRFRTLLLSATYSKSTRDILVEQFHDENSELIEVSANFLRPEPEYFVHHEANENAHRQRVEQLLMTLPRPLILYCTTRTDAEMWSARLNELGYWRTGMFHGQIDTNNRKKLISKWKNDQLDIMVATSAFGVGMNKKEIRSIIHAAIPENIDRYYQDCGRAGRDGRSCQVHLVWHKAQMKTAKSLAVETLIGVEKGFARWKAMFDDRKKSPIADYMISLNTKPVHIDHQGDKNEAWNRRTLLLMQRAGLIKLVFADPKIPDDLRDNLDDNNTQLIEWFESYYNHVHIRHCDDAHYSEAHWNTHVEKIRQSELNNRRAAFTVMEMWLEDPSKPLCKILQKFYEYQSHPPELTCGGCPGCRQKGKGAFSPTVGTDVQILRSEPKKKALFVGAEKKVYYNENMKLHSLLMELRVTLRSLITSGEYVFIRADRPVFLQLENNLDSLSHFWSAQKMTAPASDGPEIVIIPNTANAFPDLPMTRFERIIIAPEHLADPQFPHRTWCASAANALSLDTFIRQLQHVNN
ncbi:TPA: ATP-dependent DNA helicase RecQ [Cronobacter sakazakii]|nr:ATP-dependent DNA helicase RecQ [Cronobacter sakazakii]MDK1264035.1 protein DpdF [Cronobacter sakazakii]MDK1411600.1 protein DpdF [Cronobacter sakazakii]HCC0173309.1 ATP-dependent DNA helicase RecQ [Cronobacter sakazakii]HCC0191262.1 ATP-dependent DNA helicase RecQ [Cronobacter sakazakii]